MFLFILACFSASIDGDRFQPPKLSISSDTGEVVADTGTGISPLDVDNDGDGLSENEGDCDDTEFLVTPEANEQPYDGVDNDCNPETPDDDLDGDGFGIENDCDDQSSSINPNALDAACDGFDNNCDGLVDELWSGDVYEPNDAFEDGVNLGDITGSTEINLEGYVFPVGDIDRYRFYIDDGYFDFFGFSVTVSSPTPTADIVLTIRDLGNGTTYNTLEVVDDNSGGGSESVTIDGGWGDDGSIYEAEVTVSNSEGSCASPYLLEIDPDA